jgi:hypothetical protein
VSGGRASVCVRRDTPEAGPSERVRPPGHLAGRAWSAPSPACRSHPVSSTRLASPSRSTSRGSSSWASSRRRSGSRPGRMPSPA